MINAIKKILKVFDEHGLWDEGVELVGSWCFYLYQKHCGVGPFPLKTLDIDFLIPVPYKARKKIDLVELLKPLGFNASFNSDGSIYLWSPDLRIDFISPEKGKGSDKAINIKALSIRSIPLRYMGILFKDPFKIKEGDIHVLMPNPVAFLIHKLLIANRRKTSDKREKDLEQALLILESIEIKQATDYYQNLPRSWKKTILNNLKESKKYVPLRIAIIEKTISALQVIE